MRAFLEPAAFGRIREHPRAQRATVESAVAAEYFRAEMRGDFGRAAAVPGATTSRARTSVSMIGTPSAANRLATVLLPLAMPPVSPTRKLRGIVDYSSGAANIAK